MRKELTTISGSSIQSYQNCPLRWCFSWISNRVPRKIPAVLTVGTGVHAAFDAHFKDPSRTVGDYVQDGIDKLKGSLLTEDETKAVAMLGNLREPLDKWVDEYPIDETLESELAFEFPVTSNIKFQGRPDRVIRVGDLIFHQQHKTLAATANVGLFIDAARRSLHELVYGRVLEQKYCGRCSDYSCSGCRNPFATSASCDRPKLRFGGTIYNIIRKLQHRSRAKGKIDKGTGLGALLHEPHEFFIQSPIGIDPALQQQALDELPVLAEQMKATAEAYLSGSVVVSNRGRDRGPYGNSRDPYLDVLMGVASLDDDSKFQDRIDPYENNERSSK